MANLQTPKVKMNESIHKKYATHASVPTMGLNIKEDGPDVNLQLHNWNQACTLYKQINDDNYEIKSCDIIDCLCRSLANLVGQNINSNKSNEYVEGLEYLFSDRLEKDSGINLRKECSELFSFLHDMNIFYCELIKHPSGTKIQYYQSKLTSDKLKLFMCVTQEIWKWFLSKTNEATPEQLKYFRHDFG